MKKLFLFLCIASACLAFPLNSSADTIVNTGEPDSGGGYGLESEQWLASEFTLGQSYTLTDIYGWIDPHYSGIFGIAVYGDGGEIPNTANQIFYGTVYVEGSTSSTDKGWYGLSSLDWNLSAGTYWVAFEVRSGGFLGYMASPSPNPLINEAYRMVFYGYYDEFDYQDIGVKILGDPAPVPEPATMLLLGSGLVGLARFRRKFRKN